jgi:hypothetical protein
MLKYLADIFIFVLLPLLLFRKSQDFIEKIHSGLNDNNVVISPRLTDNMLLITRPINFYLKRHPRIVQIFTILSSFCLDFVITWLLIDSVNKSTFDEVILLWLSIIIRQLSQLVVQLEKVPTLLWQDPGVPSILVKYEVSTDFYFSGHTVCSVVGLLFLQKQGYALLGWAFFLLEISFITVTHSHYFPDILTGITVPLSIAYLLGY